MNISTRSNERIKLLLVKPLSLERMIHKSKRAVDTLQAALKSKCLTTMFNRCWMTLFIPCQTTLFLRCRTRQCCLCMGEVLLMLCFVLKIYFISFYEFYWVKKEMMNFFNFTYYLTTLKHHYLSLLTACCDEWKCQSGSPANNTYASWKKSKGIKANFQP